MKRALHVLVGAVLAATLIAPSVSAAQQGVEGGGWSETTGSYSTSSGGISAKRSFREGVPHHSGEAQRKSINGTTHKRAHGWTRWNGVCHHTTAQLEHHWPRGQVISSSGRVKRWHYSEAWSSWVAYNPNARSNGYGLARTYYGRSCS
ncbi:hypothetical protein J5X07_01455 [Actinomyces bowdenii]|uniref:Lactococcin 972 family bacteriocin n=1 Tax=Actinomyces bowdenii TaxID=131109 RepID=A0A3P1V9K9_9ACTO|nr:hypothetical protein [Actinomyces bowdenii]MBO3723711.1 hypothetical protein [Actinomyces bowdenii]RRD30821.1 hypothetical protein EII10_01580 [Actinomyces bowdenii]